MMADSSTVRKENHSKIVKIRTFLSEWNDLGGMDERRREEGGECICWWGYDVGWGTIGGLEAQRLSLQCSGHI